MVKLKKILRMTQDELLTYCYLTLLEEKYEERNILYTKDYVYAKGEIPILLVAHTDIVHTKPPELIVHDRKQKILWSPTGIGGDDRCGVYAILKLCEKFKPYVLFTTAEEKGGLGAKEFVKDIPKIPVNFIIEIDRRGNNQAVFYDCGNNEFQDYILNFGFELCYGSYSDVATLSNTYDIAGCNLSAGYYEEHTKTEHIFLQHLYNTMVKVIRILKDKDNHKFYDCQKIVYVPPKNVKKYYYDYDDLYDEYYYNKKIEDNKEKAENKWNKTYLEIENDWYDLTDEEWKKKYKIKRPLELLGILEMEELQYVD